MKVQSILLVGILSLFPSLFAQDTKGLTPEEIVENIGTKPIPDKLKEALKGIGATEAEFRAAMKKKFEATRRFNALGPEKQADYRAKMAKASKLAGEKRIAESLYAGLEALDIFDGHSILYNIIGSNYIELRDIDKAVNNFEKAAELEPFNAAIQFNLAEAEFVNSNYQASLEKFKRVAKMEKVSGELSQMTDLIQFKIELSHLGISNDESLDAEVRKKHRKIFDELVNPRDYRHHSLLTYYSKAAQRFADRNTEDAYSWLRNGRYVFSNPQIHLPWLDTMLEFGFVNNAFKENAFAEEATLEVVGEEK